MDFQKNDNLIIKVEKSSYSGKEYYDFRTYYKDKNDEFKPTQKGFTISPELIHDFLKKLNEFFKEELKE